MSPEPAVENHTAAGGAEVDPIPAPPDPADRGVRVLWIAAILAVILWVFVMAIGFTGSVTVAAALVAFLVTLAAGTMFALSRL